MTGGDVPLPFEGDQPAEPPPPGAPCIYVATKITGTAPGSPERQIIEFAVVTIRDAVIEATRHAENPWHLRVHAPVEWTTPEQTPDLTPGEVFARNAHHVLSEADALIVYGWSPSAGVGQEIIWAAQSGLPVLYVEPQGHPPSRQVAGTPGDLTIIRQSTPDHLKDEIRRWVRRRRHQLEANSGRRRGRATALAPLHARLQHEWANLVSTDRHQAAAHLGVTPGLIDWWLSGVDYLAAAPIAHIILLSTQLLGSTDPVLGRRELTISQLDALFTARDEHGWDDPTTEALRRRGEVELAQPAVRRFRLDSPEDWTRLWEAANR
ncbi:MAG: hypothetical protein ACRDY6_06580 [Acidimicrobiia bacterium]